MWRPVPIRALVAPRSLAAAAILALGLAAGASAQVQVKVLPDGTRMIFNENEVQRSRRTARYLLPVPTASLGALIDLHARRQNLDPRLVQAIVQVESGYNTKALSKKGAMGLMQLMPDTARMLRVDDPYDPEQNVRGGTTYLRQLLGRYEGDLTLALAAYNAGPTAVARHQGVPPYRETRDYVRKILSLYRGTSPPSLLLQEHARDQAGLRQEKVDRAQERQRGGDPVYLTRDAGGRILITTTPKPN